MVADTAHGLPLGVAGPEAPAAGAPSVGVEEELLLLHPTSGMVTLAAAEVIRECASPGRVVAESMRFMVETRTPVCRSLDEVQAGLSTMRRRVAQAAGRHGHLVVASGVPPFGIPEPPPITDQPRYRELGRRFPSAMRTNGICGCHVHVGVADRRVAVEALLRLRPWMPALVALAANSPIWEGQDSGCASRRFGLASRWPTVKPAPAARSVEEYDGLVDRAIASGRALDRRSVYFLARLSPRYPTIEVRVADTCLSVQEAVAYAGLVRALVGTAIDEVAAGRRVVPVRQSLLRQSCWSAARAGLVGTVTDPRTGGQAPAWDLVDALVAQVQPRLGRHGDEARVLSAIERARALGGGADRQRRLFEASRSPGAFVTALAERTAMPAPG